MSERKNEKGKKSNTLFDFNWVKGRDKDSAEEKRLRPSPPKGTPKMVADVSLLSMQNDGDMQNSECGPCCEQTKI